MFRITIYGVAALEIGTLLYFVAQYASGPGTAAGSGGPEMALVFFVLLPLAVLSAALAVFHFAGWRVLRGAAALVAMGPVLLLAYWGLDKASYHMARRGRAVAQGDAATVAATARTTDMNQTGETNTSFLGLAMTQSIIDEAIVKALLDAGADPSLVGSMGRPVFFEALAQPDMLAQLLQRGVRVDAVDGNGWTGLMHATWNTQWPAVALLLAAGADVGHVAADVGGPEKATAFVRYRAGIDEKPIMPELLALEALMRDPAAGAQHSMSRHRL